MKTLCFSLGLLLLVVCCSDATPQGAAILAGPKKCCFKFSVMQIPPEKVTGIIRTHPRCQQKAFIVSTVAGREFCFRDFKGAVDSFNGIKPEGSG